MQDTSRLGIPVPEWTPPQVPQVTRIEGRYCIIAKVDVEAHGAKLFDAFQGAESVWDFLPYGPFPSLPAYHRWLVGMAADPDLQVFVVSDRHTGRPGGVMTYLRIAPAAGSIELGHINFAPALQRGRAATEAMTLMIRQAFELGYRRFEWKCNALNFASRRAAQRLGLSYEGVFRKATVIKGRNRDTAWFAATDDEWPALKEAYDIWLSPRNFDGQGRQRERLGDLTTLVRVSSDPAL